MTLIIGILIFIVSLMLIGIVLIQNSKGGGLASGFSSSNQIIGVQRTTDFLEKGTWILAIALLCLCLLSTAVGGPTEAAVQQSELESVLPSNPIAPPQGLNENNAVPAPE